MIFGPNLIKIMNIKKVMKGAGCWKIFHNISQEKQLFRLPVHCPSHQPSPEKGSPLIKKKKSYQGEKLLLLKSSPSEKRDKYCILLYFQKSYFPCRCHPLP